VRYAGKTLGRRYVTRLPHHDSQSRYRVNNCRETPFPHTGKTKK
jgi:hypothetical protein